MSATNDKVRTGTQVRYSTTGNAYHRSTGRLRLVDCRCNHAFGRGNGQQCHFTQSTLPDESMEKGNQGDATSNSDPSAKEDLFREGQPHIPPQWCVNDRPLSPHNDTTTYNLVPKNQLIPSMIVLDKKEYEYLSPIQVSNKSSKEPTISAHKQTSICLPSNRKVQCDDPRRTATTINEFDATREQPFRSQQRCKTKRNNERRKDTSFHQQSSKHTISSQQQIQFPPHTVPASRTHTTIHQSRRAQTIDIKSFSARHGSMMYEPPRNPSSLREHTSSAQLPSTQEEAHKMRSYAK